MPEYSDHCRFWDGKPYVEAQIIEITGYQCGYWYLTHEKEIGIFLRKEARGQGIGPAVVEYISKLHTDTRLLANVAPGNPRSQRMFRDAGFTLCQYTYELLPLSQSDK